MFHCGLKAVLIGVLVLLLAACELDPPPHNDFPDLTYGHLPPLTFNVATIEIDEVYLPKSAAPHVELSLPVSLSDRAARWGRDRLRAAGSSGHLRYSVMEASVLETKLEASGGLTGLFTVEQSERYDAKLIIQVELLGQTNQVLGSAIMTAERSTTVAEDVSLTARELALFEMVERVMNDMNGQLEITLRDVFGAYLL